MTGTRHAYRREPRLERAAYVARRRGHMDVAARTIRGSLVDLRARLVRTEPLRREHEVRVDESGDLRTLEQRIVDVRQDAEPMLAAQGRERGYDVRPRRPVRNAAVNRSHVGHVVGVESEF